MRIKLFILVALLAGLTPAAAQGPGWSANGKVVRIVTTANGGINVRLSPDLQGCTSQGGYGPNYASIFPTHPGIDRIHAQLLAAHATGTVVALYFTNSECAVGEIYFGGA